jgi:hypothetical protein
MSCPIHWATFWGAEARAHPTAEISVPILLDLRQNPYSLPSDLCAIRGFGQFEIN